MNAFGRTADKERLNIGQRVLELIFAVLMIGLFGFMVYHQQTNSGFFTEKFGALEMLALYVPMALAVSAMLIRVLTGQQQPARPIEVLRNLALGLGSLWLLIVFPFNFAHLADTLPETLHVVLSWMSNDVGRILLILQAILGPVSALVTAWQYVSIRHRRTDGAAYHNP